MTTFYEEFGIKDVVYDNVYTGYLAVLDTKWNKGLMYKLYVTNAFANKYSMITPKIKRMLETGFPVVYISRWYKTTENIIRYMLNNIDEWYPHPFLYKLIDADMETKNVTTYETISPASMMFWYIVKKSIQDLPKPKDKDVLKLFDLLYRDLTSFVYNKRYLFEVYDDRGDVFDLIERYAK